jgi:hypothetical protein
MDTHGSWQTNSANWVLAWARERNNQKRPSANGEGLTWLGPRPDYLGPSLGVSEDIEAASREEWSEAADARVRSALAALDADCGYDEWLQVGMALCELGWAVCVGTGGITEDRGFELWDEWSSGGLQGKQAKKYPGREALERKCASFERDYKGRKITVGSIFHRARECGWKEELVPPPAGSSHNRTSEADEEVHEPQKPQQEQGSEQERQNRTNQQEKAEQTGREQNDGTQTRKIVSATPFQAFDFATLPPRQWIYGRHYVRRYVTATVAPGGSAKTALKLAEAISLVIGRDLLNANKAIDRQRVWYWNGEDPLNEINCRIAAISLHYQIDPKELEGWLFIDTGHDMPICLATENRGTVTLNEPVIDAINDTIEQNQIDVVILDPLISVHKVSENNNPLIDQVVKLLGRIANQRNCSIEIVHHVRKPATGQQEITADDTRGGGAIVNAVRSCQVLNRMSSKEAEQARIEKDERYRYFRVDSGKQNLAPPEKAKWRYLHSTDIPNGDNVQVVESWQFPEVTITVTQEEMEFIRATAQKGIYNRWHTQARYWIGHPLADHLGLDVKNKADRQDVQTKLYATLRAGLISLEQRQDAQRRVRGFVVAGPGSGKAQASSADQSPPQGD